MPLKSLHPIKFEPIWAEFETWGWERQSEWASTGDGHYSNSRRRRYIAEQLEFAKVKRKADAQADAMFRKFKPFLENIVAEQIAAAGAAHANRK
jgi:hypothetical protein